MKTKLIILGCGSSIGVPRIDGYWGNCKKNIKYNIRTRCSAFISKGSNSILIDTSPDIRMQLLNNQIAHINSVIYIDYREKIFLKAAAVLYICKLMRFPFYLFSISQLSHFS